MKNDEVLKKIKDIIFSAPEEMYKYEEPENCFEGEWEESSYEEKAFMLVEDLLLNLNREQMKKKEYLKESLIEIKLEKIPRFYSVPDENMFFNTMYSVPSIKDIKGIGKELYLYCLKTMTNEERKVLIGLFNRYQIPIPVEIQL